METELVKKKMQNLVEFREVEGKLRIRGGHRVFWENSGD